LDIKKIDDKVASLTEYRALWGIGILGMGSSMKVVTT